MLNLVRECSQRCVDFQLWFICTIIAHILLLPHRAFIFAKLFNCYGNNKTKKRSVAMPITWDFQGRGGCSTGTGFGDTGEFVGSVVMGYKHTRRINKNALWCRMWVLNARAYKGLADEQGWNVNIKSISVDQDWYGKIL